MPTARRTRVEAVCYIGLFDDEGNLLREAAQRVLLFHPHGERLEGALAQLEREATAEVAPAPAEKEAG